MKKLFIVAGEASGDTRAAEVMCELKTLTHNISFEGLGGECMRREGMHVLFDLPSVAVVGLTDVIKKYFFFRKIFYMALNHIKQTRPDAVVLVDYPGFNLRLARKLKKLDIPVIYYISPQVWAWANWRVKTIARIVSKMLVILPFEVDFYKKTSLDVEFVGHPLIDSFKPSTSSEQIRKQLKLSDEKLIVGILAGSRKHEVKRMLPVALEAAEKLRETFPNVHFLISKAPHQPESRYEVFLKQHSLPYTLVKEAMHDVIIASDFCWVTSGTATLETALGCKPHIIMYRSTFLTYLMAKHLVTIPYIGLVNIIAGKEIIPELLQFDLTAENLYSTTKEIVKNKDRQETIKKELEKVREKLGRPHAARRAAEAIARFLNKKR